MDEVSFIISVILGALIIAMIIGSIIGRRNRRSAMTKNFEREKAKIDMAMQKPEDFDQVYDWAIYVRQALSLASNYVNTLAQREEFMTLKMQFAQQYVRLTFEEYDAMSQSGSIFDAMNAFENLSYNMRSISHMASWYDVDFGKERFGRFKQVQKSLMERIELEAENLMHTARDNFQDFELLRKLIKAADREFNMRLRPDGWTELVLRHIEYPTFKQFGHLPKYRHSKQQFWHIECTKVLLNPDFDALRAAELIAVLNRPNRQGESPALELGLADGLSQLTERFVAYRLVNPIVPRVKVTA